ncbi:hypothetical protein F9222_22860 [Escherichia coli]|nr:hypothetical protein F9222_22860 [Escherichia coli]
MTTINLNQLKQEWQNINYAMSLSDARIKRLCNSTNKEDAISVGFWDRFCDLFRPEKKANVLEAVWNLIHSADNNAPENEETLPPKKAETFLPEKAKTIPLDKTINVFLRLKRLSNKPDTFVTELEITKQGQDQYDLRAVFKINNEIVGDKTHRFEKPNTMKSWIGNNQFIRNENKDSDNNELTQQILKSAIENNIDLHNISLTGVDLTGANLTGANLTKTNLMKANLEKVVLTKTTNLTKTELAAAKMSKATYDNVELTKENIERYLSDAINPGVVMWPVEWPIPSIKSSDAPAKHDNHADVEQRQQS